MKERDQTTDADLLERSLHGEEAAFRELYQRHLETLYRFAYRMLGSPEHAEDVAHDCFLGLIRNPRRYDPGRGSLRTYLFIAVRNLVLKRLRKTQVELSDDEESAEVPASCDQEPLPRLLAEERCLQVRKSISALPPLQREVLVLFEYEGQSLAQVAEIVGTDVGAVKSRLHRARKSLRRELSSYMNGAPDNKREQANHE